MAFGCDNLLCYADQKLRVLPELSLSPRGVKNLHEALQQQYGNGQEDSGEMMMMVDPAMSKLTAME